MNDVNFVLVRIDEKIALYVAPFYETFQKGDYVGVIYEQSERVCRVEDALVLVNETDKSDFVLSCFGYKSSADVPKIAYRLTYTPMIYKEEP